MKNRRELVFLFSARDNNPNGDPDDENRPRTDDADHVLVSDVRLKRTIRDYFLAQDEKSVLIRRELKDDGGIKAMKDLIIDALGENPTRSEIQENLPKQFLDVRLFGVTATVPGAQTSLTGPVQFTIGRSLNIPRIYTHTITSTMSAARDKKGDAGGEQSGDRGGAMGSYHILDYAMIAFEGVICPHLAKIVGMTEEDVNTLFKGMWRGTRVLQSRSKVGHSPKLLVSVVSKNADFLIGGLAYLLSMDDDAKEDIVKFDDFIEKILDYKEKIQKIEYAVDPDLVCIHDGNEYSFEDLVKEKLKGITCEKMDLDNDQ